MRKGREQEGRKEERREKKEKEWEKRRKIELSLRIPTVAEQRTSIR